jgi:hypothetical protein
LRIPIHARPVSLIRLADDVEPLNLPLCDAIISPMHQPEASPACARPPLIEMGLLNKYISLHAPVGWASVSYLFSPLPAPLPPSPILPNLSRNGSLSSCRHLSNPNEALLQVLDCRSFGLTWAKGFAARMPSAFVTHPTSTHCSWGF